MEMKPERTAAPPPAGRSAFGYDRLPDGRRPPFSEEAEQAVLGAALVDKEAVGLARERIDFDDFYRLEHQLIFRAMCRLYENDQAVDPITIADLLEKRIDGFGEAFRRLSWDEIGPRSILSRALAGSCQRVAVVALPGHPNAVRLAVEGILQSVLPHLVALLKK